MTNQFGNQPVMLRSILHYISVSAFFLFVSSGISILLAMFFLMVPEAWDYSLFGYKVIPAAIILFSIGFTKIFFSFSSPYRNK